MTKAELIKALETFPDDWKLVVDTKNYYVDLVSVYGLGEGEIGLQFEHGYELDAIELTN